MALAQFVSHAVLGPWFHFALALGGLTAANLAGGLVAEAGYNAPKTIRAWFTSPSEKQQFRGGSPDPGSLRKSSPSSSLGRLIASPAGRWISVLPLAVFLAQAVGSMAGFTAVAASSEGIWALFASFVPNIAVAAGISVIGIWIIHQFDKVKNSRIYNSEFRLAA